MEKNIIDRNLVLDFSTVDEAIEQWSGRHELVKNLFEEGIIGEVDQVHILVQGQPCISPFNPYTFLKNIYVA